MPVSANGTVTITANIRWMVCKDVCIPGKGTTTLTLQVSTFAAKPGSLHTLFKETLTRIPRKLDPGWRNEASLTGDTITLTVSRLMLPTQPPAAAEFFPFDDLIIENVSPQTLSVEPRVFELRFKKSEQMSKPPARLRGVVVVNGRYARLIDTPLRVAAAQ